MKWHRNQSQDLGKALQKFLSDAEFKFQNWTKIGQTALSGDTNRVENGQKNNEPLKHIFRLRNIIFVQVTAIQDNRLLTKTSRKIRITRIQSQLNFYQFLQSETTPNFEL